MAVITNITGAWSAGVELTADEVWQNTGTGAVRIGTGAEAPSDDADGLLLGRFDSVRLGSGLTVYYRSAASGGQPTLTRTVVA